MFAFTTFTVSLSHYFIRPVDVWAIGCLLSEMLTGEPLFPGESDIDQLYLITKCFGEPLLQNLQYMYCTYMYMHINSVMSSYLELSNCC